LKDILMEFFSETIIILELERNPF
jgi:hypothetical protein